MEITFLTKVRPDFIQIDSKGHPGISSYLTKVGYHVKGFQKDPLKLWREMTKKKQGWFIYALFRSLGFQSRNRTS
jgi:hypothetical protein